MNEKIQSLRRAVQFGLDNGKTNMIVNLDVLAAVLGIYGWAFCEHGVRDGDWCQPCNAAQKVARNDPENPPS